MDNKLEKLKEIIEMFDLNGFCNDCAYNDEINGCEKGGCDAYFDLTQLYDAAVECVKGVKGETKE